MKKVKIFKLLVIAVAGVCFFVNNHFENLSRTQLNNGMYTDVYMNGAPFLLLGFILLGLILIVEIFTFVRQ